MTIDTIQQISTATRWFIVGVLCVGAAWDIFVESQYGSEATISYQIQNASFEYPIIPFAAGVLMGHFFWQTFFVGASAMFKMFKVNQ